MLTAGVSAGATELPEQRAPSEKPPSEKPQPGYYRTQTERW
jgi:hypothetical protein